MSVLNKHTRNYTVLLLTSLGIITFILFYVFGYIPQNEKRINARNYRVLHRMGTNINNSISNYSRYVGSSFVSDTVKKVVYKIKEDRTREDNASSKLSKKQLIISKEQLISSLKDAIKKDNANANRAKQFYFKEDNPFATVHRKSDQMFHYLEEKGNRYLDFPSKINNRVVNDLKVNDNIELGSTLTGHEFEIKIPVDSLLGLLMRWDTFKHLIILRRDFVAKTSEKQPRTGALSVIYNSRQNADLISLDTLARFAEKKTGGPAEVNIAGDTYKIYTVTQRVGANERWYLYGTIPSDKYESESRAIPGHIISIAALAVVILLLAFPFLKLLLMSKQERLYRRDVTFAFVALFIGVALMVLLLFDCYSYYGADRFAEKKRLETLSADLELNLKKEISFLLAQIKIFDAAAKSPSETFPINPYWEKVENNKIQKEDDSYFPNFQRVFWINQEGMMTQSWTTNKQNNALIPVHYRDYYKIIREGRGWSLPGNNLKFALQSITSTTDGEKYAVISTQAELEKKPMILALATKLSSLYKTILPAGYGFCLVDKEGNVLFHQNENLNLNENLLEETNFNPYLKAALYGQIPAHFTDNYQGNQQELFVSPVKGLPFFLVTFVNNSFHKAFNVNLLVLTTMFLSIYFVSISILTIVIVYLNKGRGIISFKWLWPKKNYAFNYFKILVALVLTGMLALLLTDIDYQISIYFIYVYAALYAFIFLHSNLNQTAFMVTLRRSLLVVLGLNLVSLFASISAFLFAGLFQLLLILLLWWLDHFLVPDKTNHLLSRQKRWLFLFNQPHRFHGLYVGMLTCWIILASGIPAFVLFRVAYNYEAELTVRYNQMYLASALKNIEGKSSKDKRLPDSFALNTGYSYMNFYNHTKTVKKPEKTSPINSAITVTSENIKQAKDKAQIGYGLTNILDSFANKYNQSVEKEDYILNDFIPVFRPIFRNVLADEYFLKTNRSEKWLTVDDHNLEFDLQQPGNNQLRLSSHLPKFQIPFIFFPLENRLNSSEKFNKSGAVFWLDIMVLIVLLYMLLSFLIKRVFNINLVARVQKSHEKSNLLHPAIKEPVFLISLPHSLPVPEIVKITYPGYTCKFIPFNLSDITNTDNPKVAISNIEYKLKAVKQQWSKEVAQYVIIQNFDDEPFSEPSLRIKLMLLQTLAHFPEFKIVLQSAIPPLVWEEALSEEELKTNPDAASASYRKHLKELCAQLNIYLKMYQSLRVPTTLTKSQTVLAAGSRQPVNYDTELMRFIDEECAATGFLREHYAEPLKTFVRENNQDNGIRNQDIIMQLQSLAQLYYRGLWNACSEEEHYFLFDIAQDGMVNAKNVAVLSSLVGKGLLIVGADGIVKPMNESFRYFILTAVNPAEALRYEKSSAQGGRWEMYKTPLLLILIGAVLFFFFTQKNTWANIIAVLTVVSSFLSILPRLSFLIPSFFASNPAQSK